MTKLLVTSLHIGLYVDNYTISKVLQLTGSLKLNNFKTCK